MISIFFWQVFAGVLGANLLTVGFVWACLNISRKEQRQESFGIYLSVAVMTLAFCGASLYLAFGGV